MGILLSPCPLTLEAKNPITPKNTKTPSNKIELAKKYKTEYIEKNEKNNMSDLKKYLNQQLKNKNFKKEWDNLQPKMELIRTIIKA